MKSYTLAPDSAIHLFVKEILVFEEDEYEGQTVLPFYADGYPGLLFQQTESGLLVKPHQKAMPDLFLYGQTIKPIELVMTGNYQLIVFQLYPFVIKRLFDVNPKELKDECYDLSLISETAEIIHQLRTNSSPAYRINILTSFLQVVFENRKSLFDLKMKEVIHQIIDCEGQITINELCDQLGWNERTLERRFLTEVGISPKQFSTIIRFSRSLEHISAEDETQLTEIAYANGFSDQSHFIKVFKAYTGHTPTSFQKAKT